MNEKMILVHAFIPISAMNGPGKRSVLWVQGCDKDCAGCFNPGARAVSAGTSMSAESVFAMIPSGDVEGITLSGGEPFLQAHALVSLCDLCHEAGLSVMTYTGMTFSEIRESADKRMTELLERTDILIDGPYDAGIPQTHPWAGSGNQNVRYLTSRYGETTGIPGGQEIFIAKDGTITMTGFPV